MIDRLKTLPVGGEVGKRFDTPPAAKADTLVCVPHTADAATPETFFFLTPLDREGYLGRLGSLHVRRKLGAGGMGIVFEAVDPDLARVVALKVMKPQLADDPVARRRFLIEAKSAARLKHPNVVAVHQVGEQDGLPFLVMEYLEGESLGVRLRRGVAFPVEQSIEIGIQIARGLQAAHREGLIHRDVKPDNIWLEETGSHSPAVKILDFGLARAVDGDEMPLTQPGMIVGTPAYMAPEQARHNAPIDHRCDLFSLGAVLYHTLAGRPPFEGSNTLTLLTSLALTDPKPPRSLRPEVPVALSRLVMRLLAKERTRRPTSAAEVIGELERVGREPSPTGARFSRRVRLAGVTLAVMAAAATACLIRIASEPPVQQPGAEATVATASAPMEGSSIDLGPEGAEPLAPLTDREAAAWILSLNGQVTVRVAGKDVLLHRAGDGQPSLPAEEFTVVGVNLSRQITGSAEFITNAELAQLAGLKDLESLDLHYQPVTATGLSYLRELKELRKLNLFRTKIGPEAVPVVRGYPKLEWFYSPIDGDKWAEALGQMDSIRDLWFYRSNLTDDGITHLARLPNLQVLAIHQSKVTVKGIDHIAKFKSLKELVVEATEDMLPALRRVKQAFPECNLDLK